MEETEITGMVKLSLSGGQGRSFIGAEPGRAELSGCSPGDDNACFIYSENQEVKYMRRRTSWTFPAFLLALFILLFPGSGLSILSGDCEICHNLYPGMMEKDVSGNTICVSCHSNSEIGTSKTLAGAKVPVVLNTLPPNPPLAGGNFYHVARGSGDRKGHNVQGVASPDSNHAGAPPGYDRASDPSKIGYNPKKPMACAGSNGCHGDRDVEDSFRAVMGTHHDKDSPLDGSTTARSYRYLKSTGTVKGVVGLEDADWGQTRSLSDHNEYSPSINSLCTGCHSKVHGAADADITGPWFGHPTGIVLPNRGEYMNFTKYSPEAPLGRAKVPESPGETVTPGSDVITCLTCHMAHASPNDSILRWDFMSIIAGKNVKGGCIICHTSK
jgi:hypothetical protein